MAVTRKISWKQAMVWGWAPRTVTLTYTNARTGRRGFRADRLARNYFYVMNSFARQGREADVVDPKQTRRVRNVVYEIELPPISNCRRCGKQSWNLDPMTKICRGFRCQSEIRKGNAMTHRHRCADCGRIFACAETDSPCRVVICGVCMEDQLRDAQ